MGLYVPLKEMAKLRPTWENVLKERLNVFYSVKIRSLTAETMTRDVRRRRLKIF
jgi:hypothetical protein